MKACFSLSCVCKDTVFLSDASRIAVVSYTRLEIETIGQKSLFIPFSFFKYEMRLSFWKSDIEIARMNRPSSLKVGNRHCKPRKYKRILDLTSSRCWQFAGTHTVSSPHASKVIMNEYIIYQFFCASILVNGHSVRAPLLNPSTPKVKKLLQPHESIVQPSWSLELDPLSVHVE